MEKRLQEINNDRVLEITDAQPVKTRMSENALLRRKEYLEASITKFANELAVTDAQLAQIHEEANRV